MPKITSVLLLAWMLPLVAAFGNEYVHIKVHVPKDQAPSIAVDAEPEPPHKVVHHYHHHGPPHQRSRGRAPPKLHNSPLLESVILSDLDKPLHMSEHADYLNHAKELAEHLSEPFAMKKPPPPPPKKKVNTYTIIEEKHRPNSHEYGPPPSEENSVETYRVINSRPQSHHHKHYQHHQPDDDDNDMGYHYRPPSPRYQRNKASSFSSSSSYHSGGYAEPAPVEEPVDYDLDNTYAPPPSYANIKSARAPAHTLEAPEDSSAVDTPYPYDYGSSSGSSSNSNGFRPSPELYTAPGAYEDEVDAYAAPAPVQSRRRRPGPVVEWPSHTGYSSAAAETYMGADSYNAGSNSGYQYPGPYL